MKVANLAHIHLAPAVFENVQNEKVQANGYSDGIMSSFHICDLIVSDLSPLFPLPVTWRFSDRVSSTCLGNRTSLLSGTSLISNLFCTWTSHPSFESSTLNRPVLLN